MSKTKTERETVRPAALMTQQTFRLHCRARHPRLRYWSRGEHDADHRANGAPLDHSHKEEK